MKELDNIMKTKQLSGLHWSDPDKKLSDMTERDWRIFREDFDIHIQGKSIPSETRLIDRTIER